MFDIGFWELTVIAVIGLIVLGPERLPVVARTLGTWAASLLPNCTMAFGSSAPAATMPLSFSGSCTSEEAGKQLFNRKYYIIHSKFTIFFKVFHYILYLIYSEIKLQILEKHDMTKKGSMIRCYLDP